MNESIAYVKELHPSWDDDQINAEAIRTWNETSLEFMAETLKLCVELRPAARWGYYGRPGCYTGLDADTGNCTDSVRARNDALADLWSAGTALYPSVYIGPNAKYPVMMDPVFVEGEIGEAKRMREELELDMPIVAFTWWGGRAVVSSARVEGAPPPGARRGKQSPSRALAEDAS